MEILVSLNMLRLRLQRRGKRNYATYRVVVADQRAPIKGKFVADVGWYNPHSDEFEVNADDVKEWMSKGVQPTPTVQNLLIEKKVIKGDKATSWRPKVKKGGEEGEEKAEASEAQPRSEESEDSSTTGEAPEEKAEEKKEE